MTPKVYFSADLSRAVTIGLPLDLCDLIRGFIKGEAVVLSFDETVEVTVGCNEMLMFGAAQIP